MIQWIILGSSQDCRAGSTMTKIQKFSELQYEIDFLNPLAHYQQYLANFYESDLGKIYLGIPWKALVKGFKLKKSKKGPDGTFSNQGKLGLMLLKNYVGCSDERLIEQLNGNIYYQIFCDLYLGATHQLKNGKIVSAVRCELSKKLDIGRLQRVLMDHWGEYMEDLQALLMDASCYESCVRYPTPVKLLWEAVDWCYGQLKRMCKSWKVGLPRTKYNKWKDRYLVHSKKKRKSSKETVALTRGLLHLLDKLLGELEELEADHADSMPSRYYQRISTIKQVHEQQTSYFQTGVSPKDRIVSIDKGYLRPIVRGKERKKVEFGAKLHKIQINGINFIEHISFDAFNEGTRFQSAIFTAQHLTKKKVRWAGADAIYATNKNRSFATRNQIQTDFKPKGRAGKNEAHRKQAAKLITKERATRLEGSFGNEKQHYNLSKIKARTKENEILWIFFGIHTANALEIGRRIALKQTIPKAA